MTTLPATERRPGVFLGRNVRSGNLFTLSPEDRTTHCQVVGASKRGKSNFLEVMIRQDILQNDGMQRGVTVIDPHGTMVDSLVAWIADHRIDRYRKIRLLDPTDPTCAFSFNPFVALSKFDRTTLAQLLTNATLAAFGQDGVAQTPLIGEVFGELYSALGALGLPLADATDFLYRERKMIRGRHLERLAPLEPDCAAFWRDLEGLPSSRHDEYLSPVRRRLKPFLRPENMRRIFSQQGRTLDVAAAMDAGEVVLVNLKPSTHLSRESAGLLGALLVNEYYTSTFRRTNRLQHFLYVDECARFLSADVAHVLDESRKFGLSMILAHQHLGHLREAGEHVFRSVMTNTLVKVVFGGLDPEDAEYMAQLVFRGTLDLEKAKARHYRMTAVGNEKVLLENESTGTNVGTTHGRNWSQGTSLGENSSTTESRSRTKSKAKSHVEQSGTANTDSWSRSHTDSWSESQSESESTALIDTESDTASSGESVTSEPPGLLLAGDALAVTEGTGSGHAHTTGAVVSSGTTNTSTVGGSDTETVGGSSTRSRSTADGVTRGIAVTRGTAVTKGTSTTVSRQTGGSDASSVSRSTSRGTAQAYVTRYELAPGPLWSLPEQIHCKSVALAHLPVGQAYVRIGGKLPRRLMLPYLGEEYVLPERVARVRRTLLASTPFVAPASQVDEEYRLHREKLLAEASPPPVEEPENWREGGD